LDGGADGLDFYRRIAPQAGRFLTARGALALEIGADMGEKVLALLGQTGFCGRIEILHDHARRERIVVARKSTVAPPSDRGN
jgi:release factor glutamine methyltransferase